MDGRLLRQPREESDTELHYPEALGGNERRDRWIQRCHVSAVYYNSNPHAISLALFFFTWIKVVLLRCSYSIASMLPAERPEAFDDGSSF